MNESQYKAKAAAGAVGLVLVLVGSDALAQEVSPRWTVEGRGLITSPVVVTPDGDDEVRWVLVNPADSHINTRFDQALFDDSVGGFAFGVRLTDPDSPVGPTYLYQAEGTLQGEHVVFNAGRTRRALPDIMFPTLRDEDLLTFVQPLNVYSAGGLEEDALFSDMVSLTLREDFRWHAQVFVEALRNTVVTGDPARTGEPEPTTAGIHLYYDELPAMVRLDRIKHAGVAVLANRLGDRAPGLDGDALVQAMGTLSFNLVPDPVHLVDMRFVGVYQHGVEDASWSTTTDVWRGRYVSGATAIRYLYSDYMLDKFQVGLSGGYRRYVDRSEGEARVVPSAIWRLGVNTDVGLQYMWSHRGDELARASGTTQTEHRFEVAFSYGFEVMVNDTINTPRDILNAEYSYIPVN